MGGTIVSAPFVVTPVVRDGCQVLVLEGDLDLAEAAQLEAAIDACTDGLPVVVDLSRLAFLDSSGLHVLLRERESGQLAALVCPRGSNILRVLDILDMRRAVPVFGDVSVALEALGS